MDETLTNVTIAILMQWMQMYSTFTFYVDINRRRNGQVQWTGPGPIFDHVFHSKNVLTTFQQKPRNYNQVEFMAELLYWIALDCIGNYNFSK